MSVHFMDVSMGLLLMCKLWRITHKLSIAQKGLYVKFLNDSSELTHRWRPQKQFIPYNPNFDAFLHNIKRHSEIVSQKSNE